ncbi:toll/interleukin-1 receptor domain-containing protein [Sphaerisporangium corydalis]|uniref:Toll/interleukin-1 receptor domain-containing protein n=1 Tax=Sphaerisporangium corydalis TaxID=1441875 RepID=A0ABV9ECB6_9ACTN|nr:TIR domain-containing protein [Sphaerisporangium corydalis]
MKGAFDAFISYSRKQDGPVAEALQLEIQRFGVPWYRHRPATPYSPPRASPARQSLRPLRLFRDHANIPAGPDLWLTIEEALRAARWFILLASPASARSTWVRREVEWWLANRPPGRILIAWTAGELSWPDGADDFDWDVTDALPPELRGKFTRVPHWVDLRALRPATSDDTRPGASDDIQSGTSDDVQPATSDDTQPGAEQTGPAVRPPKLELGGIVADLAAPIRGLSKDEMIGAHILQRRRTWWTVRLVIAALTALVLVASGTAAFAFQQRSEAVRRGDTALANQMVAEARTIQDTQPGLARQVIVAASRIATTPEVTAALAGNGEIAQEIHADVGTLAYSGDGRLLALAKSGSIERRTKTQIFPAENGRVVLYDVPSMTVVSDRTMGQLPIAAAAFGSPSGRLLALAYGHDIQLWDVADPRAPVVRGVLVGHTADVLSVAISPDGHTVAGAAQDGALRLWDITDPTAPALLYAINLRIGQVARYALAFRPGTNILGMIPIRLRDMPEGTPELVARAASDDPSLLLLWDVTDPRYPGVSIAKVGRVDSFAFAPDGGHLVTSGAKKVRLWNLGTDGKPTAPKTLPVRDATTAVHHGVYGARGQIAAVGDDGFVRLWDASRPGDPALVAELPVSDWDADNVRALAFDPGGNRLALLSPGSDAGRDGSGVKAGTFRVWNVADGRERRAMAAVDGNPVPSRDGRLLADVGDGRVRLWDITDPTNPRPLAAVDDGGMTEWVAFSPSGRSLAVAGDDGVRVLDIRDPRAPKPVGVWHIQDRRGICRDTGYTGLPCRLEVTTVAFRDDQTVAVGDMSAQVTFFDTTRPSGGAPAGVIFTAGYVTDLAFLPGGGRPILVTAGLFYSTEVWDTSDLAHGRRLTAVTGHTYQLQDLAVRRDGGVLATASRDGTVRLWAIGKGGASLTSVSVLIDSGDVNALAFSPSGRRLATIGRDRTIRVYSVTDPAAPRLMAIIHVGTNAATSVAFLHDDHTLATATNYNKTDIWELDPGENARILCTGIGRPITQAQWTHYAPAHPYSLPCPLTQPPPPASP